MVQLPLKALLEVKDLVWTKSFGWGLERIQERCSYVLGSFSSTILTEQGWSALGSAAVCMLFTKILSDTVRYYDHYGYKNVKVATAIAIGTGVVW